VQVLHVCTDAVHGDSLPVSLRQLRVDAKGCAYPSRPSLSHLTRLTLLELRIEPLYLNPYPNALAFARSGQLRLELPGSLRELRLEHYMEGLPVEVRPPSLVLDRAVFDFGMFVCFDDISAKEFEQRSGVITHKLGP
jgi:hypothetical protein